jgi:Ketopantoate reductase PanE/ApbA
VIELFLWEVQIMSKNILLVGAGAVGQVYGKYLADAGNNVSFIIKEKYAEEMKKGVILYNINHDKQRKNPQHFSRYQIITSWSTAAEQAWDIVILCISSTALHNGLNFKDLQFALKEATLVVLQPGPEDIDLVRQHIAAEQIVQGMITLISYHTPMPKEVTQEPGMAYWFPPFVPMPFVGSVDRRSDVIQTFVSAKIAAKSTKELNQISLLYVTAFFMLFLTALEACQWKFSVLGKDTAMIKQMLQANQEAFDAISVKHHAAAPCWFRALSPWMVKSFLEVAHRVTPFDLEQVFQVHFTKVKPQTKLLLKTYIAYADEARLSAQQLKALNSYT